MKKGVLRTFEEVRSFLDRVCTIADSNRSIFGFLPKGAYEELAARDQLWIATNSQGGLAGYVLFGGGKGRMRIFQLYVEETARQSGIGKQLLSELKSLAGSRGYQTISARVAADLEGNSFWERQGFRIVKQVAGGQTTNRLINERLFELTGCSLWQPAIGGNDAWPLLPLKQPILSVSNYVIDLNVLFDVTKDREHAALMREVITNALSNEYRLSVTPEFSKELERTSISPDPILTLAKSLPTLPPVPPKVLEPVIAELRSIVFPETGRSARRHANDESDLIHLAVCIHHKVSGFITRESAILRGSRQL